MHNRSYNEQDAIQRLLHFEEGLSRLIELMKIEKKDVLGNDMDFWKKYHGYIVSFIKTFTGNKCMMR